MNIDVINPTKAIIKSAKPEEIKALEKSLTYTNTSISFLIKKVKEMRWWKRKDPIAWQERVDELQKELKSCLIQHDGVDYWVRPGSVPYLDIPVTSNGVVYPSFKPLQWAVAPKFVPYEYQLKTAGELLSVKHGNISLPTGTGKSYILLLLAKSMGLDIVIVTPGKSIFNELLNTFTEALGKKYIGGYGDGKKDITKKITIAIGKSLTMLQPGTDAYKFFQKKNVVMVDESHTFASDQLENVCHGVLDNVPYRFFVSATQTRNDGTEKLLQSIIGKNVLEMSLKEAIEGGYLCKLNFTILNTFSKDNRNIKDPMKCKRIHFLYNENIADLAAKIASASWLVKQESTLILVEELRQIKLLVERLNIPYAYVHSASKAKAAEWGLHTVKLQEQVDKFNKGEVRVLIGTKAIAIGTNMYATHNTINWMGGGSEIVTKQGPMGRSTRKLEISEYAHLHVPKSFTRIFDFNVEDQPMLKKQLTKRLSFYEESGGNINFA